MDILIGSAVAILVLLLAIFTRSKEKKKFNNGICRQCDSELYCFHSDFLMKGYICHKCFNVVWILFSVDKKYARSSVD